MTITPPANVNYGRVVWQALSDVTDGPDSGTRPDFIAPTGKVTFVASTVVERNATASPNPVSILRDPIVGVLDSEGYLCTPNDAGEPDYRGVDLIATDDPDLNPTDWVYNVSYTVKGKNGRQIALQPHQIYVPTDAVVDLTTVGPVDNATAIGIPQAEALAAQAAAAAEDASVAASQALAAAAAAEAALANVDSITAENLAEPTSETSAAAKALVASDIEDGGPVGDAVSAQILDVGDDHFGALIPTSSTAVRHSVLPVGADGYVNFNAAPFQQDAITTVGDTQYAVIIGTARAPFITKRTAGGDWATPVSLANVFGAAITYDGHNVLTVGVDAAGHVHVAGNMHSTPLMYGRTSVAGDINTIAPAAMTGDSDESEMTYPKFVTLRDGTLLLSVRTGVTNNGTELLNRYDHVAKTWTRIGPIIQGENAAGPYVNRIAVDENNDLHYFWCWRQLGTPDSNGDLSHMKVSLSGTTATARNMAGSAITLPTTRWNAAPLVLDTASTGSGMLNQNGADIDKAGHPHTVVFLYNSAGLTELRHIWHDGTAWRNELVLSYGRRLELNTSTYTAIASRPGVACGPDGRTFVIVRANTPTLRGNLWLYDVTDEASTGLVRYPPTSIYAADLHSWEGGLDSRALRSGLLRLLLVPTNAVDGPTSDYFNSALWRGQRAEVLTVELARLHELIDGNVSAPKVTVEAAGATGTPSTTTSTTATIPTGALSVPIPLSLADRLLLARLRGKVTVPAGATVTVDIIQRSLDGTATVIGSLPVTLSALAYTPWLPLRNVGDLTGNVTFQMRTTAGTASLDSAAIEIGVLRDPRGLPARGIDRGVDAIPRSVYQTIDGYSGYEYDARLLLGSATDGAAQRWWPDALGRGRAAGQATDTLRPIFDADAFGVGRPGMVFDGTDDRMTTPTVQLGSGYTIFVVAKRLSGTSSQAFLAQDNSGADRVFQMQAFSVNKLAGIGFGAGSSPAATTDQVDATPTNAFISTLRRTPTSVEIRNNGASDGSTATTDANTTAMAIAIGGRNVAGAGFSGAIGHIVVFRRSLSDAEVQAVERELGVLWNITVS